MDIEQSTHTTKEGRYSQTDSVIRETGVGVNIVTALKGMLSHIARDVLDVVGGGNGLVTAVRDSAVGGREGRGREREGDLVELGERAGLFGPAPIGVRGRPIRRGIGELRPLSAELGVFGVRVFVVPCRRSSKRRSPSSLNTGLARE